MKNVILWALLCLIVISCKDTKMIEELAETKRQLSECSTELETLKNTPENRKVRALKHLANDSFEFAKSEFTGIAENYPGTKEAKDAKVEIAKIDKIVEKKKAEDARKKALGFKVLKETSTVKNDDLKISFSSTKTGKRWTFDSYGDRYHYRDAERGDKFILTRASISSKNKNPYLPPVQAYQIKDGNLNYLGTLSYQFTRWKDYGSYLGNYADYGNDFAHSETIKFSLGLSIKEIDIDDEPVFIVVEKKGCFLRSSRLGRPEVYYKPLSCPNKNPLNVDDFDDNYVLVKIFNKSNL